MTDTTFDFDYWYEDHDSYFSPDEAVNTHFDDPCHRDYPLFGTNTGSSGRSSLSVSSDYATMESNTDDNVYFTELNLF
jgi:hypothetical protein